ncbi:MAG: hypothetical protein IKL56_04025, partial [Bacteroidaceae bacterium]|nr:hypothetical protein [Bacteroidaceae bacterium]
MDKPVFSIAPALVVTVAETAGFHLFSPCTLGIKFLLSFCPSVFLSFCYFICFVSIGRADPAPTVEMT